MDMRQDVREAPATKAVNGVNVYAQEEAIAQVKRALITLLDAVSQVARVVGVPNAVEPETGTPKVTTE